jgi:hypothetical protein
VVLRLSLLSRHRQSSGSTWAEGLDCANDQIPKRDRPTASPLSRAQQSMDQVF